MDVNEELKFLGNSKKKLGGRGVEGDSVGSRLGSGWGVRVDMNEGLNFCEN